MKIKDVINDNNIDEVKHIIKKLILSGVEIGMLVGFLKMFGLLPETKKKEKDQNKSDQPKDIYQESCTTYGDAIKYITKSSMIGSDKKASIALVKTDQKADYYDAVISIVTSSMVGSDKVSAIAEISK